MKNSVEITRGYQFRYMFTRHFVAVACIMLFEWVLFVFFGSHIARYVLSGACTVAYFAIMYSAASKLAKFDAKSYTPLQPDIRWGIYWGLALSGMIGALTLLFVFSDNMGAVGGAIKLIFYLVTAPCFGFMLDEPGKIKLYAVIIILAVPFAACVLGYIAGSSGFTLVEKLDDLTFEKEDDNE